MNNEATLTSLSIYIPALETPMASTLGILAAARLKLSKIPA